MKTRYTAILLTVVFVVMTVSCGGDKSSGTQFLPTAGLSEDNGNNTCDAQPDATAPISMGDTASHAGQSQAVQLVRFDAGDRARLQDTSATVLLEVPGASVTVKGQQIGLYGKTFTARALSEDELQPLGGMCVNVTGGSGKGYRMLPSGEHFNPPAELRVSYNDSLIPLGYKPDDIFTSYYDETTHQWTRLHRIDIDTVNHEIVSLTTHFTDFVNEVLQAPEMPETQAFVPTMMTEIEPPSPLDGLTVMQPPTANNMGTADLTYPINVPVGRGGLRPDLKLKYSSGSGNGMVGVGWNLPIPCISVETRWGVPLYSQQLETETYLLNGEHLVTEYDSMPTFARPYENRNNTGYKRFYSRVEGAFDSIIRHGTTPQNYWWEVVDREGTHWCYGHYDTVLYNSVSTLVDYSGNIAKWMLSEVRDRNGNTMFYYYNRIKHNTGSGGTQIYPDIILYCWHPDLGNQWYGYDVRFRYDTSPNNHTVSGSCGLNEDTEWLLSKIETRYTIYLKDKGYIGPDSLIRCYKLIYTSEEYTHKKHLTAVVELCGDEVSRHLDTVTLASLTDANPHKLKYHRFEYNGMPQNVFSQSYQTINTGIHNTAKRGVFFVPPSPLGSSSSEKFNINTGTSVGFYIETWLNTLNIGGSVNIPTKERSRGNVMFADLNGDGYQDIMYRSRNNGNWYCKLFHPLTSTYDNGGRAVVLSANDFSKSTSRPFSGGLSLNLGVELPIGYPAGVNGGVQWNRSKGSTTCYYTDVNADGLVDIIENGQVHYNVSTRDNIRFTTSPTEVQMIPGSCENNYYSTSEQEEIFDSLFIPGYTTETDMIVYDKPENPAHDSTRVDTVVSYATDTMRHSVVRVWMAPADGTVVAAGNVSINQTDTAARRLCRWDGLRVSVQHNDSLMYSSMLSDNQSTASPSCTTMVNRGDRIYFRVEALEDRLFDVVDWIPTVNYTAVPADSLDYEGRNKYRYNSSSDYFAWKNEQLAMSQHGQIKLDAGYSVSAAMSDTVYLKITKRTATGTDLQVLMNDTVLPGNTVSNRPFLDTIEIDSSQSIHIEALSKDEVDWTKLYWHPHARALQLQNMPDGPYTIHIDTVENVPVSDTVYAIDMWLSPKYTTYATHTLPMSRTVPFSSAVCLSDPDGLLAGRTAVIVKRRNDNVVWRIQTTTNALYFGPSFPPGTGFTGGVNIPMDSIDAYYELYVSGRMPKRYDRNSAMIGTRARFPRYHSIGLKFDSVATDTVPNPMAFTPINRQWGQFAYNVGEIGSPIIEDTIHDYFTDMYRAVADSNVLRNSMTNVYSAGAMESLLSNYANMPGSVPAERMTASLSSSGVAMVADGSRVYISPSNMGCHEYESIVNLDQETTEQIVEVAQGAVSIAVPGTTVTAPNKTNAQDGFSYHVGVGIGFTGLSRSNTDGNSYVLSDYMDLNGDGYPDVLGTTAAQYTNARGALSSLVKGHCVVGPGIHNSEYHSMSVQGGPSMPIFKKTGKSKGTVEIAQWSLGLSLSGETATARSCDRTTLQWLDINGDGLPEKISQVGMGLNIGYNYCLYSFGSNSISISQQTDSSVNNSMSVGAGVAFNTQASDANISFSAGLGLNFSNNDANVIYSDINGDGLVDIVTPDGNVKFNTGWGFSSNAHIINTRQYSSTKTTSTDINANVTAGGAVWLIKMQGSIGGGYSWSASNTETFLADFDADGLPDIVTRDDDNIKIHRNLCHDVGLLKKVKTFYGNEVDINYAQADYSPYSRKRPTVMDSVTVKIGNGERRCYSFQYKNYRYQTGERTAYGFDTVITSQWDNGAIYRTTTEVYHNDRYKFRGLKRYEAIADAQGQIYIDRTWIYKMKTIAEGIVVDSATAYCFGPSYPAIDSAYVRYYNPSPSNNVIQIVTAERFIHEGYGRVATHIDYGNMAASGDDVRCMMEYTTAGHDNMNALVSRLSVVNSGNTLLRKRTATYDNSGNLASLTSFYTDDSSSTSHYSRDAYGNIVRLALPANGTDNTPWVKKIEYDNLLYQYPVTVIDSAFSDTNRMVYDTRLGLPVLRATPTGDTCEYIYDAFGRLSAVRGPYELAGNPTLYVRYWDNVAPSAPIPSNISPYINGSTGYAPINPFCPTLSNLPSAPLPLWTQVHRYTQADASFHSVTTTFCDGMGRTMQTRQNAYVNGTEQLVVSGGRFYDGMGRLEREEEPFCKTLSEINWSAPEYGIATTRHRYDILDRVLVDSISPLNFTTHYEYGFENVGSVKQFRTVIFDANGHSHTTYSNPRGQNLRTKDALHHITNFEYDALGQLISTTDPDGFNTTYTYDLMGRITKRVHPDAGMTMWSYDRLGQPVCEYTAEGDSIKMIYDRNRLIEKRYPRFPESNVRYTYGTSGHGRGRVVQAVSGGLLETFKYGALGEVTENTRNFALPYDNRTYRFKMTYIYDSWNRTRSIGYPDGETVAYNYDGAGTLSSVVGIKNSDTYNYIDSIRYDRFGHRTRIRYGNGAVATYAYDTLQRLHQLNSITASNVPMQSIAYTYDQVGNITAVSNTAAINTPPYNLGGPYSNTYTYDAADRLVSAVGTGLSLSMTYSPAGRIGTKIQTSSGTNNTNTNCVYAYCNKIQPHAVRRVWSINDKVWHDFIYDANGNLAQHTRWGGNDDGSRSLYWTEDGRMFASVDESYVSLYGYDPSGERYSKIAAPSTVMDINAQERYVSAVAEDATIYPSPYVVASRYGYTKHIYAGADRVCTKIGSGGLDSLYQNNDSLLNNARTLAGKQLEYMPGRRIDAAPVDCNTKIDGTTGGDLTTHQTDKMSVRVDMVFRYEGLHSAMDDALTDHGTEPHRYFYHPDHLGGASWVTNRYGHPIQHLQYLPYGETRLNQRTGIYNERYTFSGKEKDSETGYYYFGARYYNSDLSLWLSVDPMSDKYPSLSPYNYCAWNPMKLVDPDGNKIVFAKGTTSEQKKQFYTAVRHLDSHNCGGRYGQLKNSKNVYTISFISNPSNTSSFNPSTKTINWCPTAGLETDQGHLLSPTTILNHEMTHATHYDDALNKYQKNYSKYGKDVADREWGIFIQSLEKSVDNPYSSEEEKKVITGIEQRTAKLLGEIQDGEVTRENHRGKLVSVAGPTSTHKVEDSFQ